MDNFEIFTWILALAFVMLGIGFPNKDRFGMTQESESDIDASGTGDEEFGTDRIPESRS